MPNFWRSDLSRYPPEPSIRPVTESSDPFSITQRGTWGRWVWASLMVLWVIVLHIREWPPVAFSFLNDNWPLARVDSAVFATAGDLLRNGGAPYLSYWDHKPPLVHLLNAAALALSGGHTWGIWLLSLLAFLAAFAVGYVFLLRSFGTWAAILGMTFFAFALSDRFAANHTEAYALVLQWALVGLLLRAHSRVVSSYWSGVLLGVLGGLCFLLRPNLIGSAVSTWLVLSILFLFVRDYGRWIRLTAGSLTGVMLIASIAGIYLVWEGSISAFIDQVFRYNFIYAASNWKLRVRAAYSGLKLIASQGVLLLPIAGWLWAVVRLPQRTDDKHFGLFLLAVIWLPVELSLASISGRAHFSHFLPLLPPLSFLTAMLWSEVLSLADSRYGLERQAIPWLVGVLVTAMGMVPVADILFDLRDHGLQPSRMQQIPPTVQFIRTHSRSTDSMFVWGQASDLYFFSGRKPASRFIYVLPLLTPGYAGEALVGEFMHDLRQAAPALIIDASQAGELFRAGENVVPSLDLWDPAWRFPDPRTPEFSYWRGPSYWTMTPSLHAFYDYLGRHYRVIARVGPRGWVIYQRVDAQG